MLDLFSIEDLMHETGLGIATIRRHLRDFNEKSVGQEGRRKLYSKETLNCLLKNHVPSSSKSTIEKRFEALEKRVLILEIKVLNNG